MLGIYTRRYKMFKKYFLVLLLITATGCGGGMYTKAPNDLLNSESPPDQEPYKTPWGNVTITKDAFIFGSDYPSDIVIPDIDGMRSTAFVVSYSAPSGVLAIDLDSNPLKISTKFEKMLSPAGTGMPGSIFVLSTTRAFLLTTSHIIDFNPMTGTINTAIKLLSKLTLDHPLPISAPYDINGDGAPESKTSAIDMSYPAGLAVANNKLYITMSNYISPIMPAVAAPGIVRIFNVLDSSPYLTEAKRPVITTDFNPTGMTVLPDGLIAITNSGVSDISGGVAHPITNSGIDLLNPMNDLIEGNISLGKASLSFQEMAVTSDGKTAYIGSASFGEVYAIDLVNRTVLHDRTNPITITGNSEGSDYLSSIAITCDNWYLFVASYDHSSIYPVDVSVVPPLVTPATFSKPFVLGFPKGVTAENPTGANTGVGAIAVRPGIPGTDYTGPDLFALTGSPGTIVTINTHGTKKGSELQIKNMVIVPAALETEEFDEPIQFYLKVEFADGTAQENITDTFTNPYSGYPVMVQWTSSDENIAAVSENGKIIPSSLGTTTITAKIGQMSAQAQLTITAAEQEEDISGSTGQQDNSGSTGEGSENPGGEEGGSENSGNSSGGNGDYTIGGNNSVGNISGWTSGNTGIFSYGMPIQRNPNIPTLQLVVLNAVLIGGNTAPQPENPIEILTDAPAGTNPFADQVVEFHPGTGAGYGQDRMPGIVLGPPKGAGALVGGTDVVSLGSRGEIILKMTDFIIADGDGPDLTVFENALYAGGNPNAPYSEPGIVSVSDDGVNYHEFSCDIHNPPFFPGCAGTKPVYSNPTNGIDPTDPSVSGGNQFDLRAVGLRTARFVKIVDGGRDAGTAPFQGFDLDAVAVINGIVP